MRAAYLASRLLHLVPTVIGAVSLVFVIIRLAPGDPIQFLVGQLGDAVNPALVRMLRQHYGLDMPIYYQYVKYVGNAITGNLGVSIHSNVPVLKTIASQLRPTVELALSAVLIAVVLGIPLGIVAAVRRNSAMDYVVMTGAVVGVSAPPFWVGILLIYLLGYRYPLFPMFGGGSGGLFQTWPYLVLPALAIGSRSMALLARMSRSAMLEVLRQDYIRTARAKGLSEFLVVNRHAIRNAGLPIVSVIGIDMAYLLGGAVTIEIVFSRPGIGRLMVEAIFSRDYPLVQGCIIVFCLGVILVNLLTDVVYSLVDPRLTYD
ncbi:MAG: ABC transporter permease [Armatimonadetes bacterium]|nr:ABC transporter permease [Armatimonadota bacterium]